MNKVEIGDEVCSVIVPNMIGKVIDISSNGLLKVQIKTADYRYGNLVEHVIIVDEAYWRKI